VTAIIKVCTLDELPPGQGRVVRIGGRDLYVYNREGRVFAALGEPAATLPRFAGESPRCQQVGSRFDVEQQDSLARTRAHAAAVWVEPREDGIYVALDDAGLPVLLEQPARAF
jgi:nitrite reductase/ring-hydroxylating ferredoxin subunit